MSCYERSWDPWDPRGLPVRERTACRPVGAPEGTFRPRTQASIQATPSLAAGLDETGHESDRASEPPDIAI